MDSPAQTAVETALTPVQPQLHLTWPDGVTWGPDELRVRSARVREELGRPWEADVVALVEEGRLAAADALGLATRLSWGRRGEDRQLDGVVLSARIGATRSGWTRLELRVGPALALLGLTRRSRIWQARSVPEIVELVGRETLSPRGRSIDVEQLQRDYPPLDYCVQYQESDLDFVHRLLEGAGIAYRFEGDDTVVLIDDHRQAPEILDPSPLRIEHAEGAGSEERIRALAWTRRTVPGRLTHADWDFASAEPTSLVAEVPVAVDDGTEGWHELHDLRRPRQDLDEVRVHDETPRRAQLAAQRLAMDAAVAHGRSNAARLAAGYRATIQDDEDRIEGGPVLLTVVEHRFDVPGVEPGHSEAQPHYENRFECIEADRPFVPRLRTPRPVVNGPHTAIVIGPEGEEIHTDALGRIQVVMHWDRRWFLRGENPSCWLFVAQPWGGVGHGALFTPRVGSEVIVSFLDGDPDRPVCTGCVYNGHAAPPQSLPEHKTRSTIRTASVGGRDGFNELTFEDLGGREEIFLHAQRNLREKVRACQTTSVGADQSLSVGRDRSKTIQGSETATVEGDRSDEVHGNATEVIVGSQDVTIMGSSLNGAVHGGRLKVSGSYVVESDTSIRLQCGATSLELTPTGLRIYAPMVQVHGGPSSVHLMPTGVQAQGPEATVVGGQSLLHLSTGAEVQGGTQVVARQGESQLRLDGNATLEAATTAIRGTVVAELSATTTTVEGQTVGVSAQGLSLSGEQSTVVEGGGAKTTYAAGLIDMG